MDDKIEVGNELLDYMLELSEVGKELERANSHLKRITEFLSQEDTYQGKATEKINQYHGSLLAHVNKLQLFYQKAAQYVFHTYETMYQNDEVFAAWILENSSNYYNK